MCILVARRVCLVVAVDVPLPVAADDENTQALLCNQEAAPVRLHLRPLLYLIGLYSHLQDVESHA